ncbi:S-adenosyl-L-methionine-dependent methyltransferase [Stipitochalara longipes BDJ]|nr:S-adenosyl-L-methionine-dependent methyltransferase [Stipitochalara longipes BDJ]
MSSPAQDTALKSAQDGAHSTGAGPTSVANLDGDAIEAGDGDDDDGYHTDEASKASTSLSSGVRDYSFENGRRYHKFREGAYQFPNDEPEQAREDMKHAMFVNVCDSKLHFAPIKNPQQVLDIGTGTGIWAIDMGDEYPEASVLGIDLSPIQPTWVPPNVRFMVDDFESPWLQPENFWDFVHGRNTVSITKNVPKMLAEAYRTIKPGGWVEFQDQHFHAFCDDGTMPNDFMINDWWKNVGKAMEQFRLEIHAVLKTAQRLKDAGFINVGERITKIPIGTWPKDRKLRTVGLYARVSLIDGLEGLSLGPRTRGLGWTPEQVQVYLVSVRKALLDQSVHSYMRFHAVYGQKPSS